MPKLSTLALFACLAMTIVSTGANAAATFIPKAIPSTSNPCLVDCLLVVPPSPADCRVPHGPVTMAPATEAFIIGPKKDPCATSLNQFKECGDKLGNLRRVTVGQVRRIDDSDKVHLVPLCDILHRSLTQTETIFLARGNVQGLIKPISENDTLMAALDDDGYRADDVLGIVRAQNMVILYVSRAPR